MFEAKILAAFLKSRKDHDSAYTYVRDLSPVGKAVMTAITEYYERDDAAETVDTDILERVLDRQFGRIPKHAQELRDFMAEVYAVDVSAINVAKEVMIAEKDRVGLLLAESILSKNSDGIDRYLREYEEISDNMVIGADADESYQGAHLDDFEDMYDPSSLIKVAPPQLNHRLAGGLLRGHHLVLGAMPEVGKTLFAINMCGGFCIQGLRTLYVGNEDPTPELVLRLLAHLSGVAKNDLFDDKEAVMERAYERGYELVTFKGLSPGTLEQIDSLLRIEDYDVVIIDQLRNLAARAENNTRRLDVVAQGVRTLARKHQVLAISVTQGADTARDKLVLNSGDIDGSNVGIPGACDVIALVGMNDDYYLRDLRHVTLAKNKRGGKHDNFVVAIDRPLSRIKDYDGS